MILTSEAGEREPTNSLVVVASVREGAIVIFTDDVADYSCKTTSMKNVNENSWVSVILISRTFYHRWRATLPYNG